MFYFLLCLKVIIIFLNTCCSGSPDSSRSSKSSDDQDVESESSAGRNNTYDYKVKHLIIKYKCNINCHDDLLIYLSVSLDQYHLSLSFIHNVIVVRTLSYKHTSDSSLVSVHLDFISSSMWSDNVFIDCWPLSSSER